MEALRPLGGTDDSVMDAESKSMRPEGGQKGRRCRRAGAVVSRQHCPPGAAFPGLPGWSSGQDHMRPPGGGSSAPGLGSKICTLSWAAGKKKAAALLRRASLVAQPVKRLPTMQETRVRSLGREDPSGGNGNPLQYPCLENPMGRGAWWAAVHGVTKGQTRLSGEHFHFLFLQRRN